MTENSNKVKFRPGDTSYVRNVASGSPFLKRGVINFSHNTTAKASLVKLQQQYYDLLFKNEKEPFLARNQVSQTQNVLQSDQARFLDEPELIGNNRQIDHSLTKVIEHLIHNLEENPQSLFTEAENMKILCADVGFHIHHIETFDRISSWEEFLQLLRSLLKNEYRYRFELLMAAVRQYADLCS